ncbi:MAG: signal peptidase I [Clostridia bacterium]
MTENQTYLSNGESSSNNSNNENLPKEDNSKKTGKALKIVNICLIALIILLVAMLIIFQFVLTPMTIVGESMENTLKDKDKVFVQKVAYKLTYGDIVVFKRPGAKEPPIKRVIGMAGDNIKFDQNRKLWLRNDIVIEEDYIKEKAYISAYFYQAEDMKKALTTVGVTVGQDELFVLGDNRNNSYDSHVYGAIKQDWIVGKYIGKF